MLTHIAACGDSFSTGEGLPSDIRFEKSYNGVIAERYNLEQKVYGRSGCCNFTIWLQVKKVIEHVLEDNNYKPFVVIATTFHERFIIPVDGNGIYNYIPDLSDVIYDNYNPYYSVKPPLGEVVRPLAFKAKTRPRLLSETVSNIQHHRAKKVDLSRLFAILNNDKMNAIDQYYMELFDTGVKKEYDEALFVAMHSLLKKHNIPHIVCGHFLPETIAVENNFELFWSPYITKYPDSVGSGHCNEEGNRAVGEEMIKHIEKYKLI